MSPASFFTLSVLSACGCVGGIYYEDSVKPEILAGTLEQTLLKGETVRLNCQIKHLGDSTVVWKLNNNVLVIGDIRVRKDGRMSWRNETLVIGAYGEDRIESHTLLVKEADLDFAGKYTCQIEWKTDLAPLQQHYMVNVLVPPTVNCVAKDLQVEEGESVLMSCIVQGEPAPSVEWSFQEGASLGPNSIVNGSTLSVHGVRRDNAGTYWCIANNGAGEPAMDDISLQVLYVPVIRASVPVVVKEDGRSAKLSCDVNSLPQAKVTWYKGDVQLEDIYQVSSNSTYSSIFIAEVGVEHLGEYICISENSLGRSSASLVLSGKPSGVRILRRPDQVSSSQFNVSWTVNSFAPVTKSIIETRKTNLFPPHSWTSFSFSHPSNIDYFNRNFHYSFPLSNLEANAKYEVRVKCENEFGESDFCSPHIFTTVPFEHKEGADNGQWFTKGEKYWYSSGCIQPLCSAVLLVTVFYL